VKNPNGNLKAVEKVWLFQPFKLHSFLMSLRIPRSERRNPPHENSTNETGKREIASSSMGVSEMLNQDRFLGR
jgi:hypothetical protein